MRESKPHCSAWVCYQFEGHCPNCGVGNGIEDMESLEDLIEQIHLYYLSSLDYLCWDCEDERRNART